MRIQSPDPVDAALRGAARAAGAALGAAAVVTARLRRDKPLHPSGAVAAATLTIEGAVSGRSGSPLLDEPGVHRCTIRASYAMGTGPRLPDVEGLALRVLPREPDGQPVDVLFASTGSGALSRFGLVLRTPGSHGTQTTLLPIRAGDAPLELRLEPVDRDRTPWPSRYELGWAHGRGPWQPCGDLVVDWEDVHDEPSRFDPVAHPLPGTSQYAVVAALREPAYAWARRAWPGAGRLPS